MGLFQGFDISASGMTAQQYRMDVIAENIANVNTTRTQDGTPYTKQNVRFVEKTTNVHFGAVLSNAKARGMHYEGNGVKVAEVYNDTENNYIMEYDPSHPDADENGYVTYPNVNTVQEMTDLIDASRAYEANVTAFDALKNTAQAGLNIGS